MNVNREGRRGKNTDLSREVSQTVPLAVVTTQWGLQKLGIGRDLARLTAYCGDHYQWIVTKTYAVREISKEKLMQAGLVSCYDYYKERHALKLC